MLALMWPGVIDFGITITFLWVKKRMMTCKQEGGEWRCDFEPEGHFHIRWREKVELNLG